jgi:hypothetical protein
MVDHPSRPRKIDHIAQIAKFCQNLAIITGVFAALLTFLSSEHDKRVQNVLALRSEFAGGAHGDYLKLVSDWWDSPETDEFFASNATDAKRKLIVNKFFAKNGNGDRLRSIADFYDTLSACIGKGACDQNTALYLFQSPATQVHDISWYHVEDARKGQQGQEFAKGLEDMYEMEEQNFLLSYVWFFR